MVDAEKVADALIEDAMRRAETLAAAQLALAGASIDDVDRDSFDLGLQAGAAGALEAARDMGLFR